MIDRNKNILVGGSQEIFIRNGLLIKAVDTLLSNSIQPATTDNPAKIYPNPSSQLLIFYMPKVDKYDLSLFDEMGNKIISYSGITQENFSISVINFAKGIYFYKIINNYHQTIKGKFIIN